MLCQVIICSVSDSPELTPSEWEKEFHICGSLAVEAQLFRTVVTVTDLFVLDSKAVKPVKAELFPVCKPLKVCIRLAEELKLHLLELTGTECEVTRCDLVTEGFTDLADTKRDLFTGCSLYVLEVYKNTLCSLRS